MNITRNIPELNGSHDDLIIEWTDTESTCVVSVLGVEHTFKASPTGYFYMDLGLFIRSEFEKYNLEDHFDYKEEITDSRLFKKIDVQFTHGSNVTTHSWHFFLGRCPIISPCYLTAYEGYPFDYTDRFDNDNVKRILPNLIDGIQGVDHNIILGGNERTYISRNKKECRLIKFLHCGAWHYLGFDTWEESPNVKIKIGPNLIKNTNEYGATSILDNVVSTKEVKGHLSANGKYYTLVEAFTKGLKFYEYIGQRFNEDDFHKWKQIEPTMKTKVIHGATRLDRKITIEAKWKSYI